MPILFGWGKTTVKDHGECIAATCPRCHNSVLLHHLLITVWFTLFFIPLLWVRYAHERNKGRLDELAVALAEAAED